MRITAKPFFPSSFIRSLAVGGAYYLTARLGLLIAIPPGIVTPVWIPSGIALAAILLFGKRVWPGILAASFFVNIERMMQSPAFSFSLPPFLVALGIGAGSTLQALLGAFLIRRFIGFRHLF